MQHSHFGIGIIAYDDPLALSETVESVTLQNLGENISLTVVIARS